ncbi:hypothetical protein WJX72_007762 [[Myrmecia] bisecta]|uniref:Uncharacterized protein n=1 Tax=[Myrmecia] bisecta TaxID=41462 RepID=A0AAW1QBQ0_9CHLO
MPELASQPAAQRNLQLSPAQQRAAGVSSTSEPRGCGTFQLQRDWSLKAPQVFGLQIGTSETKEEYTAPPPDHVFPGKARTRYTSDFPKETYPSDFKTTKQLDFAASKLAAAGGRQAPFKPSDSGRVYGGDVAAGIKLCSHTAAVFKNHTTEEVAKARQATGGLPTAKRPAYNIITGDAAAFPHMRPDVERILASGSTDEFEKLRGVPGFCLEPTSWEKASRLAEENTEASLGQLGRHPSDIIVYRRFRSKVLKEYVSMGDFIKVSVFGFEITTEADGRKAAVTPSEPAQPPDSPTIYWKPNDFPYYLDEGVEHHCVWCRTALSEQQLKEFAAAHREGHEWIYFVNPPALASIPAVWHAHILSRRAPAAKGHYPKTSFVVVSRGG